MKVLKAMLKDLTESYIFIPIFVLLSMIAIFYGYCFVAEHEILAVKQKSLNGDYEYKITATCRPVTAFTSAPYISVRLNNLEILTTMVDSGYDFTTDCLQSSVKDVQLIESENKVRIFMRNGQIKEIPIIYNSK